MLFQVAFSPHETLSGFADRRNEYKISAKTLPSLEFTRQIREYSARRPSSALDRRPPLSCL
jgi:hypothetical protein